MSRRHDGDAGRSLKSWATEERQNEPLRGHDEILRINAELARLDRDTRKIRSDISDDGLVDRFACEDRELRAREKAEAERLARLDRDVGDRPSHPSQAPDFDARFAVASSPIEHEPHEAVTEQVVGFQSETFLSHSCQERLRPDNE